MRTIKIRYTVVRDNGHVFSEIFTLEQIEEGQIETWMKMNNVWSKNLHKDMFTGLRDKQGKGIYEGDILQEQEGRKGKYVIVPMLGGLSVHNVRNIGQQHNELIASPTNDIQVASWLQSQEVIGNIHENPDLINRSELEVASTDKNPVLPSNIDEKGQI